MSLRKKGLVLAMEEMDEVVPGTEEEVSDAVAEVVETADEVETASVEIEELDEGVESAQDDSETLEKIHEVMEESVEKGEGLDETSAEIAEIAIESICARLGISKRTMPAMESFGSANSRVVATKIAMEGIQDRLKEVWKAIAGAFKSMWEMIKGFFAKYLVALEGTKDAIAKLDAAVKPFDDSKGSAEEIANKGLASALAVDGKADVSSALEIFNNHIGFNTAIIASSTTLKNVVNNAKGDLFSIDLDKLASGADEYLKDIQKVSKPLVGGVSLNVEKEEVGGLKGFFAKFKLSNADASVEKLPALSQAEMVKVVGGLKELQKSSEAYKDKIKDFENVANLVISVAQSLGKAVDKLAEKSEDEAERKLFKDNSDAAAKSMNAIKNAMKVSTTTVPSLNIKALKAGIQYVNSSMKAYK